MSENKKYRPSNGTEGEYFMESHCYQCIHDNGNDKICDILMRSMFCGIEDKEYPEEWTYDESGKATCTAWKKWDWGRDGDPNDPDNPNYRPPDIDNPAQLMMPFIFDEIGVSKYKEQLA